MALVQPVRQKDKTNQSMYTKDPDYKNYLNY